MARSPKKVLESQIERQTVKAALAMNYEVYKFTSPGRAGVPDRLFLGLNGALVAIEFKREDEKPGPLQLRELKVLRDRGVWAIWASTVEEAVSVLKAALVYK